MTQKKQYEIEKKYTINIEELPFNLSTLEKQFIEQAYISTFPTIRIRKKDNNYYITIKTKFNVSNDENLKTKELETEISQSEYNTLLGKLEENTIIIKKNRYFYPLDNGLVVEIDEYFEHLDGLYTAEVEFNSIEQAEEFIPPIWFNEDVTFDKRYTNANLSKL